AVEQAQRDRARAERLLAIGAVPARRAEDARAVEATAQARLQKRKRGWRNMRRRDRRMVLKQA
ncbi:MAG TPA: hypothetical protein VGI90_03240, partial [Steroidobacteraceae bacterium]